MLKAYAMALIMSISAPGTKNDDGAKNDKQKTTKVAISHIRKPKNVRI